MPFEAELPIGERGFSAEQRPSMAAIREAVQFNSHARKIWLDAGAGVLSAGAQGVFGAGFGSYAPLPDVTTTTLSWNMTLPLGYVGRRIRLQIFWSQSGAVTGNFRLSVYLGLWKVPGPDLFTAPATLTGGVFSAFNLAATGVANDPQVHTIEGTPVTPNFLLDNEHVASLRIQRAGGNPNDTCADVLQISGVLVTPRSWY